MGKKRFFEGAQKKKKLFENTTENGSRSTFDALYLDGKRLKEKYVKIGI